MKKYLEVLQRCPLFEGIEEEQLLGLLACLGAKVSFFDKKYTLMGEGNSSRYIGVLLSGSAQVVQVDYYGNRSILSTVEPSMMFGEAFACAGLPAVPVTVVAEAPGQVMFLDSQRILHPCENHCGFHQQLIFNLMKDLATKTILFHQKIQITAKRSTREKLMAYLMVQAKRAGSNRFTVPFDRQELADYLGVDRSGLSAEISKLRKEGVLLSRRKEFQLL